MVRQNHTGILVSLAKAVLKFEDQQEEVVAVSKP